MNSPPPPSHAPDSAKTTAPAERRRGLRAAVRTAGGRVRGQVVSRRPRSEARLARILDLFEEHVYAGEITPDGRYVHHDSGGHHRELARRRHARERHRGRRLLGVAHRRRGPGAYEAFNRACCAARMPRSPIASSGSTERRRVLRDRGRPRRKGDGGMLVDGIISDITAREEAAARLAEARRPVHEPARRRRRSRVSRDRNARRQPRRSCSRAPAAIACSAAPSPTRRWRTGMPPCIRDDRAAYDAFNRRSAGARTPRSRTG